MKAPASPSRRAFLATGALVVSFSLAPVTRAQSSPGMREPQNRGEVPRKAPALPGSLAQADRVFCYAGNLGWDPAEALAPLAGRAHVHDDLDALVAAVAREARHGDHVLVMSNGGFGGVHAKLLAALGADEVLGAATGGNVG